MQKNKMDAQCEGCGKKYKINLSGVSTQYVKFTCNDCRTTNMVKNPNHSDSDGFEYDAAARSGSAFSMGLSIRTKIILVFVLMVLISLSIVGWVASSKSRDSLVSQAEAFLKLTADQKANEYELSFKRIEHEVETIARIARDMYERPAIAVDFNLDAHILMPWTGDGYGSPEVNNRLGNEVLAVQHLAPFLKNLVTKHPIARSGYLATATRIMVMDNPFSVATIGKLKAYDNTKRPWYTKAVKEGKTIWSEPYIDADTKDIILTCSTPVYLNDGRQVAVASCDIKLSTIQQDILTLNIGYSGYAMLVDSKGTALVRPGMQKGDARWDKTYNSTDLLRTSNASFNTVVGHMVAGRNDIETFETEEGEKLMAYSPVPEIGASMAIVVNKHDVVAPARKTQQIIIWIWIIVGLIACVVGFLIGDGITKPINELTLAADRISQGEMDLEILTENRKDEIGRLAQAFNRLVTSLKIAMSVR